MRVKCETCGVEIAKDVQMAQTVEQWQYLYSLAENAMLRDKETISRLKFKVNKLEQRSKTKTLTVMTKYSPLTSTNLLS